MLDYIVCGFAAVGAVNLLLLIHKLIVARSVDNIIEDRLFRCDLQTALSNIDTDTDAAIANLNIKRDFLKTQIRKLRTGDAA